MQYEELLGIVRRWSATGDTQYDFGGVMHLLIACLDNLREFGLEAELEDAADYFEPEQALFLAKLADQVRKSG